MKRIFIIIIAILLLFSITANAVESQGEAWYIKRNGNKRPTLDEKQKVIYSYNGYYIDTNLTDDSKQKILYLTFDLGYENGNTERILDTLKENNITAAFFILDNIILKNQDLVTRMINEGHLICNHTMKHKNLSNAKKEDISNEILSLERLFYDKTGFEMAKYFRFPEGRYSTDALKTVSELGYKTVFWSFAYDDWDNNRQMTSDKAIKKIIDNTHNGAVMLFHPTSKTNADIFPELISIWREMGYEFGTLDGLTKPQNTV